MAVDPLNIWKSTHKNLPKTEDASWIENFASWATERVSPAGAQDKKGIEASPATLGGTPIRFEFNKAVFKAGLSGITPTADALAGITKFALAWESAIFASIATAFPGCFKVPPSPPTTFSVVNSTAIDASSIASGKGVIMSLVSAPTAETEGDSEFPEKFRQAFLSLTITVTGLDSVPSPSGPNPLTVASIPLI